MWAFRAYRNFDGRGGRFLDGYIPSRVAGGEASTFVSRDDAGERLVAVVINPSRSEGIDASLDLSSCGGAVRRAQAYEFDGAPGGFTPHSPRSEGATVSQAIRPYSISVFDVELAPASAMKP
jgi:hypothetical protein